MPSEKESSVYEFGRFRLDSGQMSLWNDGERTALTPKVFETLFYLVKNAGRTVTKDELIGAIWPDTFVEENNLNKTISALRRSLGEKPGENRFIVTVPGKGYRFVALVRECTSLPLPPGSDRSDKHLPLSPATDVPLLSSQLDSQRVPEVGTSPLARFFLLFGTTPYKKWEVMHIRILVWCVLIGVLGFIFSTRVSTRWEVALFLLDSICIALVMVLASFLLYVGALQRERLPQQVRRSAPWMRGLIIGLVLISWVMAGCVLECHRALSAMLALCGTAGGLKYTLFKNEIDCAILAGYAEPG